MTPIERQECLAILKDRFTVEHLIMEWNTFQIKHNNGKQIIRHLTKRDWQQSGRTLDDFNALPLLLPLPVSLISDSAHQTYFLDNETHDESKLKVEKTVFFQTEKGNPFDFEPLLEVIDIDEMITNWQKYKMLRNILEQHRGAPITLGFHLLSEYVANAEKYEDYEQAILSHLFKQGLILPIYHFIQDDKLYLLFSSPIIPLWCCEPRFVEFEGRYLYGKTERETWIAWFVELGNIDAFSTIINNHVVDDVALLSYIKQQDKTIMSLLKNHHNWFYHFNIIDDHIDLAQPTSSYSHHLKTELLLAYMNALDNNLISMHRCCGLDDNHCSNLLPIDYQIITQPKNIDELLPLFRQVEFQNTFK